MKMNTVWKPDTAISFVRFGALWKATKRINAKMKFHFFVLATCITRQNEQTTKRNGRKTSFCRVVVCRFGALWKSTKRTNDKTKKKPLQIKLWYSAVTLSFCRSVVLSGRRQNEQTKKWNSISSFWRLYQHDKTNKRRNEILFLRSVVCSLSRLDQRDKTNKRRSEIPFLRFGALCRYM